MGGEDLRDFKTKTLNLWSQDEENKYIEFGTVTYTEKTRAVIKIQDGCNNFCYYIYICFFT